MGVADNGPGLFEATKPAGLVSVAQQQSVGVEARSDQQDLRERKERLPARGDAHQRRAGRGQPGVEQFGYRADLKDEHRGIWREKGA